VVDSMDLLFLFNLFSSFSQNLVARFIEVFDFLALSSIDFIHLRRKTSSERAGI